MPDAGAVRLAGDATLRTFPSSNPSSVGIASQEVLVVISPTMWFKPRSSALGDFEQLILLGVLRLDEEAYGAAIRQEIHARSGRDVSINAVYTTLDRLERKGLLKSWVGEPTAQRGGRRRKFYALRPSGMAALRHAYHAFTAMADGLQNRLSLTKGVK
jgi:PadR family transcriptional regulator, regulatory protein PadR